MDPERKEVRTMSTELPRESERAANNADAHNPDDPRTEETENHNPDAPNPEELKKNDPDDPNPEELKKDVPDDVAELPGTSSVSHKHADDLADEWGEESFPGSDPPAHY